MSTSEKRFGSSGGESPVGRQFGERGIEFGRVRHGTLHGAGRLLHEAPDRAEGDAIDQVTKDILRTLGLSDTKARDLSGRPLPALDY